MSKLGTSRRATRCGLTPERALAALASAVLSQALTDALAGDEEARVWITNPRAISAWAWAAGLDAQGVAAGASRRMRAAA
jgi:hypothetical protein